MTRIVEIPFSVVRDHPSVRHLKSAAFGAYCALVMAIVWDGIKLAEYNEASLALLAGTHATQWERMQKEVRRALSETLELIRAAYQERSEIEARKAKQARYAGSKRWLKWKAQKDSANGVKAFLSQPDINAGMNIVQPHKIDYKSRDFVRKDWSDQAKTHEIAAINAKSKAEKPSFLQEKKTKTPP